ncbi:phytanoyl-CoA dioxygenase family protein [Bacillus sp. MUM 13]|uniref:phytanoyl-CoA dioxygenase family protein n=1 Tax=Bacillus sp. MUM 13 TaxID=1678001 RepID=UPI0008F5753D|nr:phytanoyl-CoA dioxygenase family protein [Bacillus sp. MUM 13]OIK08264.1 hypothetical protein BIV59_20445 [Bacillus sp. MUM 13]
MDIEESIVENGFVVLKNVFTLDEITELKSAVERLYEKVNENPAQFTCRYTSKTDIVDTWGVNNIMFPETYETAFGDVFNNETLMDSIQTILGEQLRFWGAHALWSPKTTDYELRWHRDYGDNDFYNSDGKPNHIQFNIPLYQDHCFIAIPGSHRRALYEKEQEEVMEDGTNYLEGQQEIHCEPGDVLLMNAHTLHRGRCSTSEFRRTLHYSLQAKDEPYGGHTSFPQIRNESFLKSMNPRVRELMTNLIEWDNAHPLNKREYISQLKKKKERECYIAGKK